MRSIFFALFLTAPLAGWTVPAVHAAPWNLDEVCQGREPAPAGQSPLTGLMLHRLPDQDLIVLDHGFCGEYNRTQKEDGTVPGGFKIRLYLAHSFTRYFDSDVQFRSSRYSVDVQDYSWAERGSREYFQPRNWFKNGINPLQMIDEPSNIFTVSIEKNGNEFFLSAFHPKFLQEPGQIRHMSGTIDGVPVDLTQRLDEPLINGQIRPGQSPLLRNQFTYGQMNYEFGYGRRIALIRSRIGDLTYIPRVGLGFMMGINSSVMVAANSWWGFDEFSSKIQIQGLGGSVGNRIELNAKNERIGIFYENRLGYYDLKSAFYDGTQHFKLMFMSNSIGLKFKVYTFKKRPG